MMRILVCFLCMLTVYSFSAELTENQIMGRLMAISNDPDSVESMGLLLELQHDTEKRIPWLLRLVANNNADEYVHIGLARLIEKFGINGSRDVMMFAREGLIKLSETDIGSDQGAYEELRDAVLGCLGGLGRLGIAFNGIEELIEKGLKHKDSVIVLSSTWLVGKLGSSLREFDLQQLPVYSRSNRVLEKGQLSAELFVLCRRGVDSDKAKSLLRRMALSADDSEERAAAIYGYSLSVPDEDVFSVIVHAICADDPVVNEAGMAYARTYPEKMIEVNIAAEELFAAEKDAGKRELMKKRFEEAYPY